MVMCKDKNAQDKRVKCEVAAIISTNNAQPTQYYDKASLRLYLLPANIEDVAVFHTSMFYDIFKKRK